ncbi:MAG: Arylsulfotransferase (ASST) [candidate division BRC1 bacterium ADurb.BinA364]|nr:MAG: Arylsulfotransferase (ASST) [candidate division BRC1 bacterium ADurb.BinA364]
MLNRSVFDWPAGVSVYKPEKCWNGLTIVNPYLSRSIYLVDMLGRVVHRWNIHTEEPLYSFFLERQIRGAWMSMLWRFPPFEHDGAGWGGNPVDCLAQIDENGQFLWRYVPPKQFRPHHDFRRLANGHTLLLVDEMTSKPAISEKPLKDQLFLELSPDNEIVWQWRTSDHFGEFRYSEEGKRHIHQRGMDAFHNNTASVLPATPLGESDRRFRKGNILGCQRHTNTIYIIDRDSGEVAWQWGAGSGQLVGPHHPTMLDNGNILIYDNGGQGGAPPRSRPYTRLAELNPAAERIVWQYGPDVEADKATAKFFSHSWGSAQRLPNGNTFSLDCHKGLLFEVTPRGEIVWEYQSPFPREVRATTEYGIYRAFRVGYEDAPFADRRLTETDGHADIVPANIEIPPEMGLPPKELP